MSGLSNKFIFYIFHSSGGYKSEVKVPAGLIPPEGCEGRICSRLLSSTSRSPSSPVVSSHHFSPYMCLFCVQISPFL